jgi:DNA-cytosine methyltransferase
VFQADFTEFAGFDWVIGGSPCTYWSIAQKNNRETEASGIGWELFQQYVRAVHEAKPKFFLYENNKSMSKEIRASIDKAFGFEAIGINSALVSAQNRQRLYWVGIRQEDGTYRKAEIEQPEDRGILLRDVLDSAVAWQEKGYALTTRCQGAIPEDTLTKHRHTMVAEPVRIGTIESNLQNPDHDSKQYRVYSPDGKSTTICGQGGGVGAKTGLYACPADGKTQPIYEVRNGFITIKDKQYPIKLVDGFYIIRKLTVSECMRLQTVPEWYDFSVISNSQAYKCLGNGWTVDVICNLMKSAMEDSNVQLDEHTALRDALALIETT